VLKKAFLAPLFLEIVTFIGVNYLSISWNLNQGIAYRLYAQQS
jgi:hypothetical protein